MPSPLSPLITSLIIGAVCVVIFSVLKKREKFQVSAPELRRCPLCVCARATFASACGLSLGARFDRRCHANIFASDCRAPSLDLTRWFRWFICHAKRGAKTCPTSTAVACSRGSQSSGTFRCVPCRAAPRRRAYLHAQTSGTSQCLHTPRGHRHTCILHALTRPPSRPPTHLSANTNT